MADYRTAKERRDGRREELRSYFWRRKVVPQILKRDNWMCHICNQRIDPAIRSPHPMSASIDHILGWKTGFDLRFLKAAHRSCNMHKGDPQRHKSLRVRPMTAW